MQLANRVSPTRWEYWRVVSALAAKDIIDALKNKTTLTLILGLAMMMLTVQALPLLLNLDDRPRVAIYDAARTGLADALRQGRDVQVLERRTMEDALASARESSTPLVAVVLPPDWESGTGPLTVEGYIGHWLRPQAAADVIAQAEQALSATAGRPIIIQSETVYPTPASGGHTVMVALGLVLATTLITAILVPYLILEEKTAHTLDVLRVSPVTVSQMLIGKGLAGAVYGLLAAAILLAFNLSLVNLWGLLAVAVLALVLFGVGLGLLVGTLVENEGAVQMWVGMLSIVLLAPLMLVFVEPGRLPAWIRPVVAWLPTTAAFELVRLSFGSAWSVGDVWLRFTAVATAVVIVFALAAWRLRRWEA